MIECKHYLHDIILPTDDTWPDLLTSMTTVKINEMAFWHRRMARDAAKRASEEALS